MKSFQETQLAFARHVRAPAEYPAPEGMEDRRMGIYRDLVYNNIESLIATVFPVLRSILDDSIWHSIVREFIHQHDCKTPYFLEISEEFLHFLAQRGVRAGDPVFLLELAHYEWIELALDVSEDSIPDKGVFPTDLMSARPNVSPLVANLSYQYPVHQVSSQFQPNSSTPTHLLVYRNRVDKVCFMEVSVLTQQLLSVFQCRPTSLADALSTITEQLPENGRDDFLIDAKTLIERFWDLGVISCFD